MSELPKVVRKNGGADITGRRRVNLIEGTHVTMTVADDPTNSETDVTINASDDTIVVRKNGGADVGTRARLNFIEGANVTLTIADDPGDGEVDITIAAAGGGAGSDTSQYFPASDPDGNIGTHPSMVMIDGVTSIIRQSFVIPKDITAITVARLLIVAEGTGNVRWGTTTNLAAMNAAENYNNHSDSTADADSACTANKVTSLDITGALTGATARDLVGIGFTRYGAHANDTIGTSVHFIGIYLEGI